jgi:hypothetical protein
MPRVWTRMNAQRWAKEEFAGAELGDARRARRLLAIAAAVVRCPSGLVTRSVRDAAEREASYRFVENDSIDPERIAAPVFDRTAQRCCDESSVIVAVDQSTLSFVDWQGRKGLGRTGHNEQAKGRAGFEVMSALAVAPEGATLGLLSQQWHLRPSARTPNSRQDKRPVEQRESGLWARCMTQATQALRRRAPNCRPWFQLDRGADINHVLLAAQALDVDFTVRSSWNRRLECEGHLHEVVRKSPVLGVVQVKLPVQPPIAGRPRVRTAQLQLRASRVSLCIQRPNGRQTGTLPITVVHVREMTCNDHAVEWFLLTNRTVVTAQQALQVLDAYRCRWRIEEFHRTWKSGVCDIENAKLRSAPALQRWATILAAVAARAERLKSTSRAQPDADASTELSRDEIDAAILLSETKRFKPGQTLTLEQAVDLIALVGGYTGRKSSGGPPGVTVIGRGLHDVLVASRAIALSRKSGQ